MNPTLSPPWVNSPSGRIKLEKDNLHIWRIPLNIPPQKIELLKNELSSDEIIRSNRLLDPEKRNRFIAARGSLRLILGKYLPLEPDKIRFEYGPERKPFINNDPPLEIAFNLSHSAGLAALAITDGLEVGIDIERIDRELDYERLAAQFFSPDEMERLKLFSPCRRRRGFYRIWTAKEAALKCAGSGFGREPGTAPALPGSEFETTAFHLAKNFVATLSTEGKISSFTRWHLSRL